MTANEWLEMTGPVALTLVSIVALIVLATPFVVFFSRVWEHVNGESIKSPVAEPAVERVSVYPVEIKNFVGDTIELKVPCKYFEKRLSIERLKIDGFDGALYIPGGNMNGYIPIGDSGNEDFELYLDGKLAYKGKAGYVYDGKKMAEENTK